MTTKSVADMARDAANVALVGQAFDDAHRLGQQWLSQCHHLNPGVVLMAASIVQAHLAAELASGSGMSAREVVQHMAHGLVRLADLQEAGNDPCVARSRLRRALRAGWRMGGRVVCGDAGGCDWDAGGGE